jgi:Transmembrane family 220, helix
VSARWIWRGVNGLATCAFLFFAVVQNNDPDPVRWMAIYLAAALCCALELLGRLIWPLPALAAVVALVWAGIWAPRVVGQVDWGRAFTSAGMSGDVKEEEARETGGLVITTVWCAVLAVGSATRKRYEHPFQPPPPRI